MVVRRLSASRPSIPVWLSLIIWTLLMAASAIRGVGP